MVSVADPRFPVGPFEPIQGESSSKQRAEWIDQVAEAPARLRSAIQGLSIEQLDTPYRPGGWTVRQVVHHIPDSHSNAYTRFKLALTENEPTIKPIDQHRWSELADARTGRPEVSVVLLEALHERWVLLLRSLDEKDFARRFLHPEVGRFMTLDETLQLYAWHGRHHVAQITSLRERMGW